MRAERTTILPMHYGFPAAALSFRALLQLSVLLAPQAAGAATRPVVMGARGVVVSGHHAASDAGLTMLKNGGKCRRTPEWPPSSPRPSPSSTASGSAGKSPSSFTARNAARRWRSTDRGRPPPRPRSNGSGSAISKPCRETVFCRPPCPPFRERSSALSTSSARCRWRKCWRRLYAWPKRVSRPIPLLFQRLNAVSRRIREEWPSSAKIFLPGGKAPQVGDIFVQKDLAHTLRRLVDAERSAAAKGRKAGLQAAYDLFYRGEMTRQIVAYQKAFQCTDANGFTSAGLLDSRRFRGFRSPRRRAGGDRLPGHRSV